MEENNLRKRLEKIYEELNEDLDEATRKALIAEAKALSEIDHNSAQLELDRLNSNAKNTNDEERIAIEKEKIQVDKKRIRSDKGRVWAYLIASFGMGFGSFFMEPILQKDRLWNDLQKKFADLITRMR